MCDAPVWEPVCIICEKREPTEFIWGSLDCYSEYCKNYQRRSGWECICLECWNKPENKYLISLLAFGWERYHKHINKFTNFKEVWLINGKIVSFGMFLYRKYGAKDHLTKIERDFVERRGILKYIT